MEKAAIDFHEAQFVSLPGQSNIYGLLSLKVEGTYKLVVATVRGQVFCLEYQRGALRPPLLPINFTYIPADAEVISIDGFVKEPNGAIIGVTLVKRDSEPKEIYFNLYGIHSDPNTPFQWEKIAEDCMQPLNLEFTPFQLTHTQILAGDKWETVFLLSGDDLKVHMYKESFSSELCYQEEATELWFPELQDLPSSVTYMDMKLIGYQRLSALGCQNGYVKCALVDLTSSSVVKHWSSKLIDGPITSVKIFTFVSKDARINRDKRGHSNVTESLSEFHLLVGSAIELAAVFLNVMEQGLSNPQALPCSHLYDSVLCTEIADVNWDGENELVLGTYGKYEKLTSDVKTGVERLGMRLLFIPFLSGVMGYRYHLGRIKKQRDVEILVYQLQKKDNDTIGFELVWQRSFAHPLHCLWYGDLTNDGLCELVAVSMGGVHILQHNLQQASAWCAKRLSAALTVAESSNIHETLHAELAKPQDLTS